MELPGVTERTAAVSTFANAFTLNWLTTATIAKLSAKGIDPPLWRSGNAPGGDEANRKFIDRFKERVRKL
jgi:uncharacterized phosphosugar-binding protein